MVEQALPQKLNANPRFIAFYLPQFYPTPYNDAWWGKGFTEWTNVVKARPRFRGHYQPHLPADLGFYDLRLPETRDAQAELAKQHGIYGFCYYHYWFSGKRILERPLDEVLASGKPDFPFCICWANETWKKTWVGRSTVTLLEQNFSFEDDLIHIRHLIPMFEDRRYIRIEGKPLVLVYRVELLPEPRKTAEIWRNEAIKAGLGDLFLVNVQSTYLVEGTNPDLVGFDAAMRFEPRGNATAPTVVRAWRTLKSPIHNDRVTLRSRSIVISSAYCPCGTILRAGQEGRGLFAVPLRSCMRDGWPMRLSVPLRTARICDGFLSMHGTSGARDVIWSPAKSGARLTSKLRSAFG